MDDFVLVEERALIEAMRAAHRALGVVLEPAGAAGLAALFAGGGGTRGGRNATILTGGNLTTDQMREWLGT